jgi:alcohol dehydrogenase class IV
MNDSGFRFDYAPGTIRCGTGCVADLGDELAAIDAERALVVTGRTVGTTEAVIGPVRDGLGDRLVDVFAETTPERRLDTALDVADRIQEDSVDVVVGLGGGSSLDVATVASVLATADRPRERVYETFRETGTVPLPDDDIVPMIAVPTTLAGADLSPGAGSTLTADISPDGERVHGGVDDARLMPAAVVADPELIATTPDSVLLASAMNGFDKGVESLYSHRATPVTDATAIRGLSLLRVGLPALGAGERDPGTMERVVEGNLLVQYGTAQPAGRTMSLIHAFGNGLSKGYDLQQGAAHAIAAPHVLRYVFDRVDGRRNLLAQALGVPVDDDPEAVAAGVIAAVTELRDAIGLPARLRDVPGPDRDEFPTVAAAIADNRFMANAPAGVDPTEDEMEAVLDALW